MFDTLKAKMEVQAAEDREIFRILDAMCWWCPSCKKPNNSKEPCCELGLVQRIIDD